EKVTTVVVDKTGTLTEGKPRLVEVRPANGFTAEELLSRTAAVEQASEHQIAAAIVAGAKERNGAIGTAEHFDSTTGGGVKATVAGREILVGQLTFLVDRGIADELTLADEAAGFKAKGQTVVFATIDGCAAGFL